VSQDPPSRAVPGAGPPAGSATDPGAGTGTDPRTAVLGEPRGAPDVRGGAGAGNGSEPAAGGPGDGGGDLGGATGGGGPGGGGRGGAHRRRRRARRWITEWVVIVLIAVGVAFGVRTYVAETYFVPSTSMWPTLKAGDRIVVNKLAGAPAAGDIVVFKRPPAEHCGGAPVPDLVKRVIGLPGQTVSARGGQVYINGKLLKEPWLPKGNQTYTTMSGSYKVPKGDYYVMGDNRVDSCDSRTWGPVKGSYIVGQVFLILWPPSRIRFF
jgi:signal peptidase I